MIIEYKSKKNSTNEVTNLWYSLTGDENLYSPDMGEVGSFTVESRVLSEEEEQFVLNKYKSFGFV